MPRSPHRRNHAAGETATTHGCLLRRDGLTLAEVMIASAVMAALALTLGALTAGVREAGDYTRDQGSTVLHGRTVIARIERALRTAQASESFPGALVVDEVVGGVSLPHALAVWNPATVAASPTGLPTVSELVVFVPSSTQPGQLLEIRDSSNTASAPATSDTTAWRTLIASLRTNNTATRTLLTDRLRIASVSGSSLSTASDRRGMVRFSSRIQPSVSSFASYRSGTTTWNNLAWPLGCYGIGAGVRAAAFQTELQLTTSESDPAAETFPMFGSELVRSVLTR